MPNINVHSCVIVNMHIAHTEEEIEINANQAGQANQANHSYVII